MRSAWGKPGHRSAGRRLVCGAAALLAVWAATAGEHARGGGAGEPAAAFAVRSGTLSASAERELRAAAASVEPIRAATGETVRVDVSAAYAADPAAPQRWADHFASLVHGPELAAVSVHVATPAEVEETCGAGTLGCYANGMLVTIGEPARGFEPTAVATHEYGHHVAHHRVNPPWKAIDWGPKRWASAVGVCARAAQGTMYPGDEGRYYSLNPGEGFAEAYRALNESRAGVTTFIWSIVDRAFYPTEAALRNVEGDVVRPWRAPTSTVARGRFTAHGVTVWRHGLRTALDGELTVSLKPPAGAPYELSVRAADGRVLARGLWASSGERTARFTVCGQRDVVLEVRRRGPAGRFAVRASRP